ATAVFGGTVRCLTNPPTAFCKQPDWGPGGVVYQCREPGQHGAWHLYFEKVNPDGSFNTASRKKSTSAAAGPAPPWKDGRIMYSCHNNKRDEDGDSDGANLCSVNPNDPADKRTGVPPSSPERKEILYSGAVSRCDDGYTYYENSSGEDVPTVICRTWS